MKIISKHKDFYDYIARNQTMSDQNYLWERTPKKVKVDFAIPRPVGIGESFSRLSNGHLTRETEAVVFIVWFCGRAIPVIKIEKLHCPDEYIYSLDEMPDKIQRDWEEARHGGLFNLNKEFVDVFDLNKTSWMSTNFKPIGLPGGAIPSKMDIVDMHRKIGSPIFCHAGISNCLLESNTSSYYHCREGLNVIVNPILSSINFHKAIDAFSAFNELERFWTNEMAPKDSRMDQPVPDKINAESHGFDQFSFRKEPTKQKPKK